jgi:hypothetical protein
MTMMGRIDYLVLYWYSIVLIGPTLRKKKKKKKNKEEVLSAIDLHQVFLFFSRPTLSSVSLFLFATSIDTP